MGRLEPAEVSVTIHRHQSHALAGALPGRLATALGATLVLALALMLRAGAAKAGADPDFVCYDLDSGEVECETFDSFKLTCDIIENQNELCRIVLGNRGNLGLAAAPVPPAAAKLYAPANTRYYPVKLTRAARAAWTKAKASLKP